MRLTKHRGKWAVRTPDGRRLSTGYDARANLREVAERSAREKLAELRPAARTVAEIWATYMAEHGSRLHGAETLRYNWQALKPTFGHLTPPQVTRKLCREYTDKRAASMGTIIRELGALRSALRWHDRNTPAMFELPSKPQPKDRHLTREEAERLIACCASPHVALFVRLAIATAARKSALLSLQWPAVDFKRCKIRLGHVQGGKGRATVPMTDSIKAALEQAHKASLTPWVIEYGGKRVRSIRKGFERACERASLLGVTPHTLRHTSAVWMAEAGIPMTEIAQYLGHTDSNITYRVYARYSPEHLRTAARTLDF